jgi:two-component system sensor histidine kinase RegB
MPINVYEHTPNILTTPLIVMRWIVSIAQLLAIGASDALFSIPLPVQPLLLLVAASFATNLYAMTFRRQVSESVLRWYFVFDIIQLCGFLFFTGGTQNPFCLLLLGPLTMAASLLSLYSLCLLIMLTVLCVSVMSFGAYPLQWPDPAPFLSPSYIHSSWFALMVAFIFISFIVWRLAMETRLVNAALVQTRAILAERRRVSELGALAAAAVHELGSPLGTIAVITKEMELDTHPDDPFADDIKILREQTEKCKKILADLAINPGKKMESMAVPMRLDRVLMEIATESGGNNRNIATHVTSRVPDNLPKIAKTANLEYGIGNLIGIAVSYAREKVTIAAEGTAEAITVIISDDGPGFTPGTLQAIGQPYISTREGHANHMGLGIFISVSLLEGTGASLRFFNAPTGAVVSVTWPRSVLEGMTAGQ